MSNTNLNTDLKTLPLSLKDSLTTPNPLAYIKNALAKSSVGIGLSYLLSAQALIRSAFFVPALWWAVLGTSVRRFSVSGRPTCTVHHPMIGLMCGGSQTFTEGLCHE